MGFAFQLQESLSRCESESVEEFARGEPLRAVLTRYLLAVEAAAETDMLTSILLLDDGQLSHGAAPSLPAAYCSAIDGAAIGPDAGSCGTAAYLGRAIYVADIAADPLWDDYRQIALEHGLRACWSTPIRSEPDRIVGTFAIYHLTPRGPTPAEIASIETITAHVARAITFSRASRRESPTNAPAPSIPSLKLVSDNTPQALADIEHHFEQIVLVMDKAIDAFALHDACSADRERLQRAKEAAIRGAALARNGRNPRRIS